MEQRTTLREVPSGRIDMVWNGVFAAVQFNCSCLDALELCQGMCCRKRAGYAVELQEWERTRYLSVPHPTIPGLSILATKEDGSTCVYQSSDAKCFIHGRRPQMCRQWHCSPQGEKDDQQIVRRDAGWMLMPVRKEEADFVKSKAEEVEEYPELLRKG